MIDSGERREIIAKYSALKVSAWVVLIATFCIWTLVVGASREWRLPAGRYGFLFPEAVVGSIFGLAACAAVVVQIALARGAAIAKIGDTFVLYYPFGRRRVSLEQGLSVFVSEQTIEAPTYGVARWLKTQATVARQVTIHRPGKADLNFRTGLLRDSPVAVAERMSALLKDRSRN